MRWNWALQGFAKSLLDVADNLERAAGAVPTEALQQDSKLPAPEIAKHLRTLLQGVQMTDKQLTAVSGRLLLLRNMLRLIAGIMHVSCCTMAMADRF
jgi:molecular chaperone GrpE (heat shock protein)